MTRTLSALLLPCLLALPACSNPAPSGTADGDAPGSDDGLLARTTRAAIDEARKELATADLDVGGKGAGRGFSFGDGARTDGLPPASISATGDLLIDGKPVPLDDHQRALVLEHRRNVLAVADAGMEIGAQGAALGLEAASGALGALFTGGSKDFEARMRAEGARIEQVALKLCGHLPAMLESQQAVAAAVPAFVPYATMTADDVEDCHRRAAEHDAAAEAADATAHAG
ncbi:hypothetical protein CO641_04800 [Lysobacteraceae bacterium NML91-0213]|nr:hypothetical protein CO641_04800 [Xanthomonadaceae bacterium NML91-0213]